VTIQNASFETPGVEPGQADQWDEVYDVGASDIAAFQHHDWYTRPYDDFETSWGDNHLAQTAFGLMDIVAALFSGLSQQYENFESGWWQPHLTVTDPHNGAAMLYYYEGNFTRALFSGAEYDGLEQNWGTSPFNQASIYTYAAGSFTLALFDAALDGMEDFEEEWKDNENAQTAIAVGFMAYFDVFAPEAREDFEEEWFETLP